MDDPTFPPAPRPPGAGQTPDPSLRELLMQTRRELATLQAEVETLKAAELHRKHLEEGTDIRTRMTRCAGGG